MVDYYGKFRQTYQSHGSYELWEFLPRMVCKNTFLLVCIVVKITMFDVVYLPFVFSNAFYNMLQQSDILIQLRVLYAILRITYLFHGLYNLIPYLILETDVTSQLFSQVFLTSLSL